MLVMYFCSNIPYFVYPFINWWTFGLCTLFRYYKQCFYKYPCTSFCVDLCFHFSWVWVKFLGHMVALSVWGTARFFVNWFFPLLKYCEETNAYGLKLCDHLRLDSKLPDLKSFALSIFYDNLANPLYIFHVFIFEDTYPCLSVYIFTHTQNCLHILC